MDFEQGIMRNRLPQLLLPLLLACSGDSTGISAQMQKLQAEYAAWHALGIQDYDVDYQQLCFCAPSSTAKVTLLVRQGVIAAVMDSAGNFVSSSNWSTYKSVDQIFASLIDFADRPDATLTDLTFDPALHYPTHAHADMKNVADAGYVISAGNLQRSPPATQLSLIARDVSAPIQTDSVLYRMDSFAGGVAETIRFALTNTTADTITIANCAVDGRVYFTYQMLKQSSAGSWNSAYILVTPACRSADIIIPPGGSFRDSASVRSPARESNTVPKFISGYAEGIYKLSIQGLTSNAFILDDPRNDAYSPAIK